MSQFSVAAVLFDGFEMLDLYGPLEMYCMDPALFSITTVAETMDPVRASGGPCTLPEDVFAAATPYDILLVPGGEGTSVEEDNPVMLRWLAEAAARAQYVTSVCTGSSLLARAGVLEGHAATTNKLRFDDIAARAPEVDWRASARWVESGNRITSSGVSAGMDMTLALIEKLGGPEAATYAALEAEYIRNTDPDKDPFAVTPGEQI